MFTALRIRNGSPSLSNQLTPIGETLVVGVISLLGTVGPQDHPASRFHPQEYADNLTNSGVHGAVLVLEPTFNAEAMATALGIPSGKHILRRHLAEEMSSIFHPAK